MVRFAHPVGLGSISHRKKPWTFYYLFRAFFSSRCCRDSQWVSFTICATQTCLANSFSESQISPQLLTRIYPSLCARIACVSRRAIPNHHTVSSDEPICATFAYALPECFARTVRSCQQSLLWSLITFVILREPRERRPWTVSFRNPG